LKHSSIWYIFNKLTTHNPVSYLLLITFLKNTFIFTISVQKEMLTKCVKKHEVTRPFERPKCRLEDNIRLNLKEIG